MQIELKNISFGYTKNNKVLNNLSIQVPKGAIYGFIGPNGVGKSTVMQLITGILSTDEGEVSVFEKPLKKQIPTIFNRIGALVESPALYLHLSGIDNLRCVTILKNIAATKIPEVLEIVGLSKNGKQKVKKYSLGMKQRLAIAMTLLGDPELLLLDEPVNGLDPSGINDIRALLIKLNREKGVTIFISSHLLSEIEKICTHIGIINQGEMKFEGTIQELSNRDDNFKISVISKDISDYLELIESEYGKVHVEDSNIILVGLKNRDAIPEFVKFMIKNNIPVYGIRAIDNLEEKFFSLTK